MSAWWCWGTLGQVSCPGGVLTGTAMSWAWCGSMGHTCPVFFSLLSSSLQQPFGPQMTKWMLAPKFRAARSGFISIHPLVFSSLMALAGFSPISLPLTTFQQDLPLPCSQLSPLSSWAPYLSSTYFLFLLFCLFFSLSPSLAISRLDINLPLPKVEVNL